MTIKDFVDEIYYTETGTKSLIIAFAIVLLICVPIGIIIGRKSSKKIFGDNESGAITEKTNVIIKALKTTPHPLNLSIHINMVVFELEDGSRLEFAIKDSAIYGTMAEGDCGTLKYRGKKFISFDRKISF